MKNFRSYPALYDDWYPFIGDFIRRLTEYRMNRYASEIFQLLELETEKQFADALEKTIEVLQKAGIPAEHHIMPVYKDVRQTLIADYKLSPLAFGLLCMHVEPVNEKIARLRVEWIKKLL